MSTNEKQFIQEHLDQALKNGWIIRFHFNPDDPSTFYAEGANGTTYLDTTREIIVWLDGLFARTHKPKTA